MKLMIVVFILSVVPFSAQAQEDRVSETLRLSGTIAEPERPRLARFSFSNPFTAAYETARPPNDANPETARTVTFRTARENYSINLDSLPHAARAQLSESRARTEIVTLDIPASSVVRRTEQPRGLRADCSELPMSLEQLESVAASPNVNNIEDFLRAIPEGTFQGYTLVYNSLSAQRGRGETGVSPMWPRVLRTNRDGSITFSYTCNPNSETFNDIEVLYTENGEVRARSFRVNRPPGTEGLNQRVNRNPTSCQTCHSTGVPVNGRLSMRHIWNEYFQWSDCKEGRGISIYGSNDDMMGPGRFRSDIGGSARENRPEGCSIDDFRAQSKRERENFRAFREAQRDNPCYNLLPNPTDTSTAPNGLDYSFYPYASNPQDNARDDHQDYALRTNLRFNDMYSHHNSVRIARIMRESPDYEKLKYYLAMDAADCWLERNDRENIQRLVPGFNVDRNIQGGPGLERPFLYAFSLHAGLQPADWSLQFHVNPNHNVPSYTAAMPSETDSRDFGMQDVVGGEVVRDIGQNDPSVRSAADSSLANGVQRLFGPRFGCIDDVARGVAFRARGDNRPLCQALRAANNRHIQRCFDGGCGDSSTRAPSAVSRAEGALSVVEQMRRDLAQSTEADLQASVERGRALVQSPTGAAHCINCHSRTPANLAQSPPRFLFMPSESLSPADQQTSLEVFRQRVNEGFFGDIESNIRMGMMPSDGAGLNEAQTQDVLNYLRNLAAGPR